MCGIAGIVLRSGRMSEELVGLVRTMTAALHHRGPDDSGLYVGDRVILGNRRLAIIDIGPPGRQPMVSYDGTSALPYNGEIYTSGESRRLLKSNGVTFAGRSDTEVLMRALERWGPSALARMSGIFGFAWWDGKNGRLILARDPLGVKQVYYYDRGSYIAFASEIKALLVDPDIPRRLDTEALNEYLHFHTPLDDRTFFKNIKQLRPGEYVEIANNDGVRHKRYWVIDGFEPRSGYASESVAELTDLLGSVIHDQLAADVPVGAFFSGGIDSTAVAAFAKRAGQAPRCFGIHFTGQGVIDERPYQEQAARALGLDLELTTVDGSSFTDDFMRLMYFQDQPVIGAAMIPMYYVSKLAARHVKVCLGGQAADEIFGGYARYALVHPTRVVQSMFSGRRAVGGGNAAAGGHVGGNLLKQLADTRNLRRAMRRVSPFESWSTRYFENFASVSESTWLSTLDPQLVSRPTARQKFEAGLRRSPALDPGDRILHWDMQTYLPGLFHQDDRMSMANSLESRVPFADPRIVRFALHTPFDLKLRAGATKWILRQAVADVIPQAVLNRRKVGFDTPADRWMRGPHRGFVRELLTSKAARERGFFNPAGVARIVNDTSNPQWFDVVWKLASIEAWALTFLDRAPVPAAAAAAPIGKTARD
jgi:asparagine synthase (glutamine-hydrolysing)